MVTKGQAYKQGEVMDENQFHCACVFTREGEFSPPTLVDPCAYHARQARELKATQERLAEAYSEVQIQYRLRMDTEKLVDVEIKEGILTDDGN